MFCKKIFKLYNVFGNNCLWNQICRPKNVAYLQRREITSLLEWFINVFNGVDKERLNLVGPDCTCAEWLLRNGASVRFKGHSALLSDYNELITLEETEAKNLKIEEIYAWDVSVNNIGFYHFKDCNYVKKITFIFCSRITDSALFKLDYLKDSLEYLEMRSCFNVQDKGLTALHSLRNLKTLILADLVSVKNKDECEAALRKALPHCNIEFQEK